MLPKNRRELYDLWKKRVRIAKDLHKSKVIGWANKVFKEYSGESKINEDTGELYVQIAQIVMAVEETIQPHLFFQNPRVTVTAKKPDWEKREGLVAAVINQEYSDITDTGHGIELENELVVLDARLLPFGCTKTTWEVEGEILEEKPEKSALDKVKDFLEDSQETLETPVIESEKHVTERVNPFDIYLDYGAPHITKQRFIIHKMDVTKEDLMKPRYDQKLVKNMEPTVNLVPENRFKDEKVTFDKKDDPDFQGFRIYEIHDLKERVIHTMADGVDDFIEFASPMEKDEGSQFAFLWFIEIPNEVYPKPPIAYYRSRAHEYSYVYSQVSEQIDKFLPKIFVDINKLSREDQIKFKQGNLGALVGVNGAVDGAAKDFSPKVQDDLFKYLAMVKELMNLESGSSDYELASPEERKATEAALIQRGVRARRFKPQKRVKGFLKNQAKNIWSVLAKNSTEEKFVKILGADDALEWWSDPETGRDTWTNEQIAGDYDFDIDVDSMTPQDEQSRKEQNAKAMELFFKPEVKQALAAEKKKLLTSSVLEKYAKENLGIKDRSRIIQDMNILEPSQEHDLWMQGQFPPITPDEAQNPEFLLEHFQAHQAWINSPGFNSLHPQIQEGAISHVESYLPLLQRLQQQAPRASQNNSPQIKNEPSKEPVASSEPIERFVNEAV